MMIIVIKLFLAQLAAAKDEALQAQLAELHAARRTLYESGWDTGATLSDGITELAMAWADAERRAAVTA